jgi:hypothetical protein
MLGPDDVETEKGKPVVVLDHRYAADRMARCKSHEKAGWIGGIEGGGVVEAGIPAFGARPGERQVEVGAVHGSDVEAHVRRLCAKDLPCEALNFAIPQHLTGTRCQGRRHSRSMRTECGSKAMQLRGNL